MFYLILDTHLNIQDSGKTIHSAEKNNTSYKRAGFFTEMKQKKIIIALKVQGFLESHKI